MVIYEEAKEQQHTPADSQSEIPLRTGFVGLGAKRRI